MEVLTEAATLLCPTISLTFALPFRETRTECPLGTFSCPLPNQATICKRINERSLYEGAPGINEPVTRISTFSYANRSKHGGGMGIVPHTHDCTDEPGPYAGCMTAPCVEREGQITCECPIAEGPYQVSGEVKECGQGLFSGAYSPGRVPHEEIFSLVPTNCESKVPVCYQGNLQAVQSVLQEDTINCPGRNESTLQKGNCSTYGYPVHIAKDPIFRNTDVYIHSANLIPLGVAETCENPFKKYSIPNNRKALIITTSHGVLGNENCTTCKATGVSSPEFTIPYLLFEDAGLEVTLASIKGDAIPVDPVVKYYTHWDTRFWNNASAVEATLKTPSIEELDFAAYDLSNTPHSHH